MRLAAMMSGEVYLTGNVDRVQGDAFATLVAKASPEVLFGSTIRKGSALPLIICGKPRTANLKVGFSVVEERSPMR